MIWDVFLNIETPIVSLGSRRNITRITYFEEMITPFAPKKRRVSKLFAIPLHIQTMEENHTTC